MNFPYFGVSDVLVGSELNLAVGIVLRSVPSCDVCQSIQRVWIADLLFFNQYILLLEDMYEE